MIERIHLRILRQIERDGSLTAAAKSLHLTQSALSHAIRKLEDQAGTAIWRREGRRIRLTPAGDYLLAAAERLLPQLERLDTVLADYAAGQYGTLRIGMECHPCYRWLLKIVEPYLAAWPGVDIDVIQAFRFGGMAALFNHDIDILVTPDPLTKRGVVFEPVFDYEQVLVVAEAHRLAGREYVSAEALADEVLLSYPVDPARLDIFTELLAPRRIMPRQHKTLESTDIMLQLVAAGRGVAALPRWLVDEYRETLAIVPVRLGRSGIAKQIHLGVRRDSREEAPIAGFLTAARAGPA
ncbi:LysR family transcriptional regulator [Salinisphaera hydrothermalis]|uniref:HTH-type transcriptional regulator MetR n=1 Tax=Salinisphaera hydrothermalis (strain C41B8) TaxID=1304275 RepID=A0A084II59_SALHC|nr:LysR family transcriptional regulator [Salinisphaera hydrothermalis]KEZ76393.1 transcriptional activator MetR [Salinisphaera hydrothermalis C41B8]